MAAEPHGLKVVADRARCFGATACALAAPEVFSLDDGGRVLVGDAARAEAAWLRFVVAGCPSGALGLVGPDGAVLVPIGGPRARPSPKKSPIISNR